MPQFTDKPCAKALAVGAPGPMAKGLPDDLRADILFDAYMATDEKVIAQRLMTELRFEQFRKDFRDRILPAWRAASPQPARAAFMLDVAVVALNRNFRYWLDFIEQGRHYVIDRLEPPGKNAAFDAFEIAWHKASLSILEGIRRPDYVADCGVDPLDERMAAVPPTPGVPVLVDPWIELARGFREEGFTIVAATVDGRATRAIEHYDAAARYEATRAEALVRKAWLLIRLKHPDQAIAALDGVDERLTMDRSVLYWSRLFRGRALAMAGRGDDAVRAYDGALALAPEAQTPKVGLMTAEFGRGRSDAAYEWAAKVRTGPESYDDPFWLYPFGDRRVLQARMDALRKAWRR